LFDTDILNSQITKPPSCDQCAQEFDVAGKAEDATNVVASAASQAEGAVKSVVGDVGNVLGSIF
jgi:predicted nucleic acid-binding Zn ribbon protein